MAFFMATNGLSIDLVFPVIRVSSTKKRPTAEDVETTVGQEPEQERNRSSEPQRSTLFCCRRSTEGRPAELPYGCRFSHSFPGFAETTGRRMHSEKRE